MAWPYSFGPDDPDIALDRATAVRILNQLEMWDDVVTRRARPDAMLRSLIETLTAKLSSDYQRAT
jgi:hypothetical protein